MNEREYFEALICKELDGELTQAEKTELGEQLAQDKELQALRNKLIRQQEQLRHLPLQTHERIEAPIDSSKETTNRRGRISNARINLPVPAAAAAALLLFLGGMLIDRIPTESNQPTSTVQVGNAIEFYESEKLAPASARLIESQGTLRN